MKIFDTQMKGLINKLTAYEFAIEDVARAIAQSIVSEGKVYWAGEKEMEGIVAQACIGRDSLPDSQKWCDGVQLSELDTVVITSPYKESMLADEIIELNKEAGATIVGIYSSDKRDDNGASISSWTASCDFLFYTGVEKGLVPMESGQRIGTPHLMLALHLYYQLYFAVAEMLEEHGE